MKADCLAIVNSRNDTLWVRSVTYTLNLAATALAELRKIGPSETLALIKSYVDGTGKEQFVEIMTPWADACLKAEALGQCPPQRAVVEVWQEIAPMFGMGGISDVLDVATFVHCADILVPYVDGKQEDALNSAYALSQNIEESWRPGKSCRSTSVGDVLVLRAVNFHQAYAVEAVGFKIVQFDTPS
jgi:hypothetical protein